MSDELATLKRVRVARDIAAQRIFDGLFDKQKEFIFDGARRKAAVCSRRAGKTNVCVAMSTARALKFPRTVSPYIALTRGQAKRLAWPALQRLNDNCNLGMRFNETELRAYLPNGACVWLVGADDAKEIEKLRGDAYPTVVIDEAASFGSRLDYLIDDVLDAALADYAGVLALVGSPGAACVGAFHDATNLPSSRWSVHRWTVLDNPKFPIWSGQSDWKEQARAMVESKRTEKGWREDNPTYIREWLGRWVRDDSSMVYRFVRDRNVAHLAKHLRYVIGADLGFDDAFAVEVLGFSEDTGRVYEVDYFKQSSLTPSDMAAVLREKVEQWKPTKIVADTGGLGKAVVAEFRKRHDLAVYPAEKQNKFDFISLLNDDFITSRAFVLPDSPLIHEYEQLQLDGDKMREDPRYDNHCADAYLYAWRECKHWMHNPAEERAPQPGTPAHHEKETDEWFDTKEDKKEWWQ